MSDIITLLAQAATTPPPDYGPFKSLVQNAAWIMAASGGLFLLVRRRSRWEPADIEVPRLAERVATVIGGVVAAVVIVLMNTRAHVPWLAGAAGVAAVLLFGAFVWFLSLSQTYLHVAPGPIDRNGKEIPQKIIGDEDELTDEARAKLPNPSLHEQIRGCGGDYNKVFKSKVRRKIKVRFQIAYLLLVLCFIVTLACAGQMLSLGTSPQYSLWVRTKTGSGALPAILTFATLDECRKVEDSFKQNQVGRFVYCGCESTKYTGEQLIAWYLKGDDLAGEFAVQLGYSLPDRPSVDCPPETPGIVEKWRFWFVDDGRLLDEMPSSAYECCRQAKSHPRTQPIIFPCAELTENLLKQAMAQAAEGRPYAAEWARMIESQLRALATPTPAPTPGP